MGRLDYEKTLDCVHCGLCLPHCPTYQETGRESSSPRGRIYAMRGVAEGRIPLDADVVDEMHFCLACRACESACPAGVQYGQLVESMRAEIDERGARSRLVRMFQRLLLRRVVAGPRTLRSVGALLRLYQRSGAQRLLRASNLLGLAPGLLRRGERMLPELPDRFVAAPRLPAEGSPRGRVAFFSGCLMPEFFGPVNAATLRILVRNGFEVLTPPRQRCCGALHAHSGDAAAAGRLQRRNASVFGSLDVDAVIVNSAGCGAALRDVDDELAAKVRDVSEFLHEAGLQTPTAPLPLRVAYDDPCHLLHGQRVAAAPRELLRSIPGLQLFDLPGSQDCCGAAGIYSLVQPEMSARLLARKIEAIVRTRPHVVTSGNPGCLLQLSRGVREAGLDVEVVHPVELLDRAYGR